MWARFVLALGLLSTLIAVAAPTHAATALPGTKIEALSKLTYNRGPALVQALSNLSLAVVQVKHAVALNGNSDLIGAPGTRVAWPLTIANEGNVVDTFTPSVSGFTPGLSTQVTWYYDLDGNGTFTSDDAPLTDTNGDGRPDTGSMAVDQVLNVLAVFNVGSTQAEGDYQSAFKVVCAADASAAATLPIILKVDDESPYIEVQDAPTGAYLGDTITYRIRYGNNGTAVIPSAVIASALDANASYVSATPAATLDPATQTLSWSLGTLAPRASGEIAVTLKSNAAAAVGTIVHERATFLRAGQSMASAEQTTRLVNHFASLLTLSVQPTIILGDGKSTGVLTATVTDALGNAVFDNTVVNFRTAKGTFHDTGTGTVTEPTVGGDAKATLVAPLLSGLTPVMIPVVVTATNPGTGTVRAELNVRFSPGAVVGRLLDSSTGLAQSGITVQLIQNGVVVVSTTTDEFGYYTLIAPAIGSYQVQVVRHSQSGVTETFELPTQVAEVNSAITTGPSVIRGQLVDQATGQGIADTIIDIFNTAGQLVGSGRTDANGFYEVRPGSTVEEQSAESLDPGSLTQAAFRAQAVSNQWIIRARTADGRITQRPLTPPQPGDILLNMSLFVSPTGRVTDARTGKPIAGAAVEVQWADPARLGQKVALPPDSAGQAQTNPVFTSATGSYQVTVVPGYYRLSISASGYQSAVSAPVVISGNVLSIDAKLEPLNESALNLTKSVANDSVQPGEKVHFVLRVSNTTGAPLAAVQVTDTLPAQLSYVGGSATPTATYDAGNNELSWLITNLQPGDANAQVITYDTLVAAGTNGQIAINQAAARLAGNAASTSATASLHIARHPSVVVTQRVDEASARVGDVVHYHARIQNTAGGLNPMTSFATRLVVQLPADFHYLPSSSRLAGAALADPAIDGQTLTWSLGDLVIGRDVTIDYAAALGIGATNSDGRSSATVYGKTIDTLDYHVGPAWAQTLVQAGLFGAAGSIVGTVFADRDGDGLQSPGEPGLPGAVLYTDNGLRVTADDQGRYAITSVFPGVRSLLVDPQSVPPGLKLKGEGGIEGSSVLSQFVVVPATGTGLANFPLQGGPDLKQAAAVSVVAGPVEQGRRSVTVTVRNTSAQLLTLGVSLQQLGDGGAVVVPLAAGKSTAQVQLAPGEAQTLHAQAPADTGSGAHTAVWAVHLQSTPTAGAGTTADLTQTEVLLPANAADPSTPDQTAAAETVTAFLSPADQARLATGHITVVVQGSLADRLSLLSNGVEVPASQIGRNERDPQTGLQTLTYVNVALEAGANRLELHAEGPGGTRTRTRTVYAPAPPAAISVGAPDVELSPVAGRLPVTFAVTDTAGLPVSDRQPVTVSARGAQILTPDSDPTRSGVQPALHDGAAVVELAPDAARRLDAVQLHIDAGSVSRDVTLPVKWQAPQPILSAGFDGALSLEVPDKASPQAAAFYDAQRPDGWRLTARVDTRKPHESRLHVDDGLPQQTLTGDESKVVDQAPSRDEVYLKAENAQAQFLYGDFITDWQAATRLTNRSGNETGLHARLESGDAGLEAYLYPNRWQHQSERLPAIGISGPYFLAARPPVRGSVTVALLSVRADAQGNPTDVVLARKPLTPGADFTVDELLGILQFKEPVASRDADLNPILIDVSYDVDGVGADGGAYGLRAETKSGRLSLGVSAVGDRSSDEAQSVVGVDAGLALPGGHMRVEAARGAGPGAGTSGFAQTLDLTAKPLPPLQVELSGRMVQGRYTPPGAAAPLNAGYVLDGQAQWSLGSGWSASYRKAITGDWNGAESQKDNAGLTAPLLPTLDGQAGFISQGRGYNPFAPGRTKDLTLGATWQPNTERKLILSQDIPLQGGATHLGLLRYEQQLAPAVRAAVEYDGPTSSDPTGEYWSLSLQATPAKGLQVTGQYRLPGAFGDEHALTLGLHDQWVVRPGLTVGLSAEQTRLFGTGVAKTSTSGAGTIRYRLSDALNLQLSRELHDDGSSLFRVSTLQLDGKPKNGWSYVLSSAAYDGGGPIVGNRRVVHETSGQLAYRELERSRTDLLGRFIDRTYALAPSPNGPTTARVDVAALAIAHQLENRWTLNASVAVKGQQQQDGDGFGVTTGLAQVGVSLPIARRLSLELDARALADSLGDAHTGGAAELVYALNDDVGVSVGYSTLAVDDPDLAGISPWPKGLYVRLRGKF